LPVKCMSLHTDVNNSREMTTKPHAGVEGNWLAQSGLCMMPHTMKIATICFIMVPFILPLSSRNQVSINIFILLFLL
jgi:hypothetical protein